MTTLNDSLDTFVELREKLPKRCPSWCVGQHAEALEEGNDLESSSGHLAGDLAMFARQILTSDQTQVRPFAGGFNLNLTAAHRAGAPHWDVPMIDIDVHSADYNRAQIALTSGEARVLARQLIHFADLADLGS